MDPGPAASGSFADINLGGLTRKAALLFRLCRLFRPGRHVVPIHPVTGGTTYDVNFWLNSAMQSGSEMTVSFNGQTLLNLTGQPIVGGTDPMAGPILTTKSRFQPARVAIPP